MMESGKDAAGSLPGIAQILVMDQFITKDDARKIQQEALNENLSFVECLLAKKIISASEIAKVGSTNFGVPFIDLDAFDLENIPKDVIDNNLIAKHHTLPLFKRGEHLYIAVDDPSKQITLNEIKFQTGLQTHSVVVEADKLAKYVGNILENSSNRHINDFLGDSHLDDIEFSAEDDEPEDVRESSLQSNNADDTPVVRFVHKVILDAVNHGASDIHFEPYEKNYRIRFRVDGILYELAHPPINMATRIAARLKVMSNLDISEKRVPQDGRFKIKLSAKTSIDFRLSTCPTVNGEKIVMRILDPSVGKLGIDVLGFSEEQRTIFLENIKKPQGMVLVTGPTGSGKTVTLYTALSLLNTQEKNISTAEDPVEIKMPGINQVNINPKTGLDFSSTLRAFLRQDPDIIMVGEIRDLETAEIAIKAAQTGHTVLSTLHTNSAPETLTRLLNMGIPSFNIASTVSVIVAQRLARKLCEHCRIVDPTPDETLAKYNIARDENAPIYAPQGCEHCAKGYRGRVGLYEVMPMTKAIETIILNGGSAPEIAEQARLDGIASIRQSGIAKVKAGVTSLEEIIRVTSD